MEDIDKCIAVVISRKIPIEWMRFNMYIEDDIYRNIPMLVFRVKETCSPNLIENLKKCVKDFHGTVAWKVFKDPLSRKGNYLLTISELEAMRKNYKDSRNVYSEEEYFGIEQFMKFCELAIGDIPLLAQYIDKKLHV